MNRGTPLTIRRVLCLGAHADDIEIGCGGTLLRLAVAFPAIEIHWIVFCASGPRKREAERSAVDFLSGVKRRHISIHQFRESYFPNHWAAIKDEFERVKQEVDPDIIFTHWRDDRHQDHKLLSDLAWNTFRNHTILEYEIPKYDGDLGQPNFYVALDEATCRRKVTAILKHYKSQAYRHWFTEDAFLAILRLRGLECGPRARYAESFHARKLVV